MKQGVYKGYNAGCCDGLEVWGVSCDAPAFQNNYDKYGDPPSIYRPLNLSYYVEPVDSLWNDDNSSVGKEIVPDLWPRDPGRSWSLYAAKVPGTTPAARPNANRPTSSRATGEWSVALGTAGRHRHDDTVQAIVDISTCQLSRAIYVDGQQTYVTYMTSGISSDGGVYEGDATLAVGSYPGLGDHHLIRIADQTLINSYRMEFLDGTWDGGAPASPAMLSYFWIYPAYGSDSVHTKLIGPAGPGGWAVAQIACNKMSFGKDYFIISSYAPGKTAWSVARVKYEGQRITDSSGTHVPGLEMFCTEVNGYPWVSVTERVGNPENSFTGDYWIVLPTCRVYLDSSVEGSDECWVCALHKNPSATVKIVTGQWLSQVYAPGGSSEWSDHADGTLSASEVANVILDTADSDLVSRYPGESWDNIQIRAYNRVYDPTTGHSKDLLLFTTHESTSLVTAEDVVADFEGGDLNSGLEEAEIAFVTGGASETDAWVSSAISPHTGSYSARTAAQDVTLQNDLFLRLTFNLVSDGYVTFHYRHDNRKYATRIPPFTELTNLPEPDNYLDIALDGVVVDGSTLVDDVIPQFEVDNGSGWVAVSGHIDNVHSPEDCTADEDKFLQWRAARIYLKAGTHTLAFTQHREWQDNGHMVSQLDELSLGELMVGEDTTGKRRWFYNGEKVQEAEWWAWPLRDELSHKQLNLRYSTAPDFITFDKTGRILYGNPHYVCRLVRSEEDATLFTLDREFGFTRGSGFGGDEGGYVRFTAIPGYSSLGDTPPCEDPDPTLVVQDLEADPPWGAFQILPVGSGGDFQVRGANASIERDATPPYLVEEEFEYEHPVTHDLRHEKFHLKTWVGSPGDAWCRRIHSWTITDNGQHLRPHFEILWKPCLQAPAWPVASPWPHKPYHSDFATADGSDYWGHTYVRPRDPLKLPAGSTLPRWSNRNIIFTTTFSDAFTQDPQVVWTRYTNDDPGIDDQWDPDLDGDSAPDARGPWPSARWQLVQARFTPTGCWMMLYDGPETRGHNGAVQQTCDDPDDPVDPERYALFFRQAAESNIVFDTSNGFRGYTDFDAVDVPCVCCE